MTPFTAEELAIIAEVRERERVVQELMRLVREQPPYLRPLAELDARLTAEAESEN